MEPTQKDHDFKSLSSQDNGTIQNKPNINEENIITEIKQKQEYNKKYYKKKSGRLVQSLCDQAKEYLRQINFDFEKFKEWEEYTHLTDEDLRKLTTFKYNFNKKEKKIHHQEIINLDQNKTNESQNMAQQLSRFEREIQQIQYMKNQEEYYALFSQYIEQWGIFQFNQFLKLLHASGVKDFVFRSLVFLIDKLKDHDEKKNLLLQACLFYDGSEVNLDQNLLFAVLDDFQFMNDEVEQCFGFVQLLYEYSEITFSKLPISKIIEIEKELPRLTNLLGIFLKNQMNPTLKSIFPSTLFCLTPPIINDLKNNNGQSFTYNIPQEWIELFVIILANSFEINQENFINFIVTMQTLFKKHYRKLKFYKFIVALKYITERLQSRALQWMGQIKKIQEFLSFVINEVILKREQILNENILSKILDQDQLTIERIPDQKFLKQSENSSSKFLEEIEQLNLKNEKFSDFIEKFKLGQMPQEIVKLLQISDIDILHPIQEICLQYIINAQDPIFSIIGIGNGKTILCNFLAAYFSKIKKQKVIVLNKVSNLSQRNAMLFEKTFASQLELIVAFDKSQFSIDYNVIFLCQNEIKKIFNNTNSNIFDNYVLLCDEADQVLFPDEAKDLNSRELYKCKEKILFFKQFRRFFLFTGTLSYEEKEVVSSVITTDIVVYPQMNKMKTQTLTKIKDIQFNSKEIWLQQLCDEVIIKSKTVPILILTNEQYDKQIIKFVNQESNHQIMISSLIGKSPNQIITLQEQALLEEVNKGYPVILVDENLGRGLDLKSSPQIEEQGGIYVILSKIPSTTKARDQVLGRTQRRFNKGQYSNIILNIQQKSIETILNEGNNIVKFNLKKLIQEMKNYFRQQLQDSRNLEGEVILQPTEFKKKTAQKILENSKEEGKDQQLLQFEEKNNEASENQISFQQDLILQKQNSTHKELINQADQNKNIIDQSTQKKSQQRQTKQKLKKAQDQLQQLINNKTYQEDKISNIGIKRLHSQKILNQKAKQGYFDDIDSEIDEDLSKRQKTIVKDQKKENDNLNDKQLDHYQENQLMNSKKQQNQKNLLSDVDDQK